ncbi:MAG: hypothetical protein E7274_02535 [Pseudobutyrivibrio ruminis]|uniref:hypothetical protein n=1 Tax=Pseudobutyrivibrio ruminis TaxID=46206 RepID=UPI0026EA9CF0|nr:hypothetical protein [Pseudobutyrivibrio ruminis]MBE5912920.1 hypothetical protein [Pseudobutyrivibrio ruminis]
MNRNFFRNIKNSIALNERYDYLLLGAVIIIWTIVLFLLTGFRSRISTYGDELLYYAYAKGIWSGTISLNGVFYQFKKIMYPMLISPAFFIDDVVLRVLVVNVINCFIMSTSSILIYAIAKELNVARNYRWYIVLIIMVFPDMVFAGTFMSEVLYFPLSLLTYYLAIVSFKQSSIKIYILFSIVSFLLYMCKEVGICVLLAWIGAQIFDICYIHLMKLGENRSIRKRCIFIIISVAVYVLLNILFNDLFTKLLVGSYTERPSDFVTYNAAVGTGVDVFGNRIGYFLYSYIYYLLSVLLAVGIVFLIRPLLCWKSMDKEAKLALLFAILLIVGETFVICLTITVKEDYGKTIPRQHLRYLISCVGLLLPITFYTFDKRKTFPIDKNKERFIYFAIIVGIALIYKGIDHAATECFSLNYLEAFQYVINPLKEPFIKITNIIQIYPEVIVTVVIYSVGICVYLRQKDNMRVNIVFGLMLFLQTFNFVMGIYTIHACNKTDFSRISDIVEINEYIEDNKLDSSIVMYLTSDKGGEEAGALNTYLITDNLIALEYKYLDEIVEDKQNEIKWDELNLREPIYGSIYTVDTVDYYITDEEIDEMIDNIDFVLQTKNGKYYLYSNNIDTVLSIKSE